MCFVLLLFNFITLWSQNKLYFNFHFKKSLSREFLSFPSLQLECRYTSLCLSRQSRVIPGEGWATSWKEPGPWTTTWKKPRLCQDLSLFCESKMSRYLLQDMVSVLVTGSILALIFTSLSCKLVFTLPFQGRYSLVQKSSSLHRIKVYSAYKSNFAFSGNGTITTVMQNKIRSLEKICMFIYLYSLYFYLNMKMYKLTVYDMSCVLANLRCHWLEAVFFFFLFTIQKEKCLPVT